MTKLRLLRFRLWHQMLTYIAPGAHTARLPDCHTRTRTHLMRVQVSPFHAAAKRIVRCQREGESERCLCLCVCVYHMLHCLLVILASRKQSCSAAFARRAQAEAQAEGKQMSLCRARRLSLVNAARLAWHWVVWQTLGRSEVTSANARFLSRSLHPSPCCRLSAVSLSHSRSTLSLVVGLTQRKLRLPRKVGNTLCAPLCA